MKFYENYEKQVGVLVKKAVGIAVKRNYYKRVFREYIRTNLDNFSDYNKILFVINKSIDVPFSQLKMQWQLWTLQDAELQFKVLEM